MKGKQTCGVLKNIRRRIAAQNDIPFETKDCTFEGECKGTCPACEAEMRYLEEAIDRRKRAGKTVVLAGIAASVMLTAAGCDKAPAPVDNPDPTAASTTVTTETTEPDDDALDGDIAYYYNDALSGIVAENLTDEDATCPT